MRPYRRWMIATQRASAWGREGEIMEDPSHVEHTSVPQTRLPRNVWAVTATSFFTDISSEMLFNLLPLFLAQVLGVGTAFIGLIEGIAETTASLLKAASGWLSDRLGARKGLAVAGYAVSTVAKPFLAFAATWPQVLGVRFADRTGKGLRTAPRDALVADSISKETRGLAFGLHRAGDTAGAAIGIGIALLVVYLNQGGASVLTRRTFQSVVWFSVVPAVIGVLVLAFGAQEVHKQRGPEGEAGAVEQKAAPIREWGAFGAFLFILLLFTLGNSSDAFLILRAGRAGLSTVGVLAMMLTFNLVYALSSMPAGRLSDRIGRREVLVGGWLVYALVYLGFARAASGWQAWALMAIYGLYYGMTEGVAKAYVADLVPADRRGRAYGAYNAAIGLAALPASLIAGVLWQGVGRWPGLGQAAPFYFGAALSGAAAVLLLTHPRLKLHARQGSSGG